MCVGMIGRELIKKALRKSVGASSRVMHALMTTDELYSFELCSLERTFNYPGLACFS